MVRSRAVCTRPARPARYQDVEASCTRREIGWTRTRPLIVGRTNRPVGSLPGCLVATRCRLNQGRRALSPGRDGWSWSPEIRTKCTGSFAPPFRTTASCELFSTAERIPNAIPPGSVGVSVHAGLQSYPSPKGDVDATNPLSRAAMRVYCKGRSRLRLRTIPKPSSPLR